MLLGFCCEQGSAFQLNAFPKTYGFNKSNPFAGVGIVCKMFFYKSHHPIKKKRNKEKQEAGDDWFCFGSKFQGFFWRPPSRFPPHPRTSCILLHQISFPLTSAAALWNSIMKAAPFSQRALGQIKKNQKEKRKGGDVALTSHQNKIQGTWFLFRVTLSQASTCETLRRAHLILPFNFLCITCILNRHTWWIEKAPHPRANSQTSHLAPPPTPKS